MTLAFKVLFDIMEHRANTGGKKANCEDKFVICLVKFWELKLQILIEECKEDNNFFYKFYHSTTLYVNKRQIRLPTKQIDILPRYLLLPSGCSIWRGGGKKTVNPFYHLIFASLVGDALRQLFCLVRADLEEPVRIE